MTGDIVLAAEPVKPRRKVKLKNYTCESKLTSVDVNDVDQTSTNMEDNSIKVTSKENLTRKSFKATGSSLISSGATEGALDTPTIKLATSSSPLVLTVYGEPTPLSRHMVSRGHMYNPSAGLQKEFASACVNFLPSTPLTGPLEATLYFYFSRPKNHYGTGKNAKILKPLTASSWHSKRKGKILTESVLS